LDSRSPLSNSSHCSQSALSLQIDWEQLHQLSDYDSSFELELLSIFVTDTHPHLEQLQEAIGQRNFSAIQHLAHYIKGASANVGLHSIYTTADQLEEDALHHRTEVLDAAYGAIASCIQQLQRFIQQQSSHC
jgi:HPt (histidine-containing phosphotransfer) domain-containing protein